MQVSVAPRSGQGRAFIVDLPPDLRHGALEPAVNHDYDSCGFRFSLSSLTTPRTTFECALGVPQAAATRQQPMRLAACAPALPWDSGRAPQVRKQWVSSADGARVPLTIAGAAGAPAPCLLVAYGAYGTSLDASYNPFFAALLNRGWTVALAHIRGGGELGNTWHDQGRRANRSSGVEDLAACARYLCDAGWTQERLLAGYGTSAGALAFAVLLNRHPGLLGALVLRVPFLAVYETMMDPTLPLTVHEYAEWGDPRIPSEAAFLRDFDPVLNLQPGPHPPTFVSTARDDPRAPFEQALQYLTRLREASTGRADDFHFQLEEDVGHFERQADPEALATEAAFLHAALGLDSVTTRP